MANPERVGSLSASSPLRATIAIICIYLALAAALLPFARERAPEMPGFNAAFGAGVFVTEIVTGFLLLVLFRQTPKLSVLLWPAHTCIRR